MTQERTILLAAVIAMSATVLSSARAADLSIGPDGAADNGYGYSERRVTYADHEVRRESRVYRSHRYAPHPRVQAGYVAPVVEHRTVVRRPVIVERRTVVEQPTIIERRTIVERPVFGPRVFVPEPAPVETFVDSGPVVVGTAPAPYAYDPAFDTDEPF